MIRVWAIPFSTNVERVSLALAHKGLEAEAVQVDIRDRAEVVHVSGQELVPVAEIGGEVVVDSTVILHRIEELHPEPRLWPVESSRRAELDVFVDWFNRVWKVAPNAIQAELAEPSPDRARIAAHDAEMTVALDRFEQLLHGRPYLFGDELSAADVIAFPFVKYAVLAPDPRDEDLFHRILHEHQRHRAHSPALHDWIERVDALPRAL